MKYRTILALSILAAGCLWGGGFVSRAIAQTAAPLPEQLQVDSLAPVAPIVIASAGQPVAAIVIPEGNAWFSKQAERITSALKKRGVTIPVEYDSAYRDLSRLQNNLILLGDRDSNLAIKKLYYLHYTLLDARYPGKGGSELRSLHNPFGDGFGILFAGGSDEAGISRAVDELIAQLEEAPMADGNLQLGYLQKIYLGEGIVPPANAKEPWLWERSNGYNYGGYFGWNLISRNLALFYMTGDERYAHEFLRLAFPEREAVAELIKADNEAYDDPSDPLAKPYHYQAIMMILYWDLVEESPVFTPEIRQRVTRKFVEQFYYHWPGRGGEYDYSSPLRQTTPAVKLAGRHYLWDATCLYALARYFEKTHPCRDVTTALSAAANVFHPFDRTPAMGTGTIYWYNTSIEPAFVYAALSNPLRYENNPVVREYADVLCKISDRSVKSWSDSYSSPFFLNLVASMTGDQAFAELVKDTGQETTAFRLGQSYWPAKPYPRNSFVENAGKVMAQRWDTAAMKWSSDFPPEEVVDFVSWRQTPDASGDYLLVDTKYESGRIPFHNFAVIGLRLDGNPLLSGYSSQPEVYCNGLYSPEVSKYSQVTTQTVVGDTVVIQGRLKNQNGCSWQRTLLLRKNRFFLAFDEVTALKDVKLLEIANDWRNAASAPVKKLENGEFRLTSGASGPDNEPSQYLLGCSLPAKAESFTSPLSLRSSTTTSRFTLLRPMVKGETLSFATVIRPQGAGPVVTSAAQLEGVVGLRLPQPALLSREGEGLLLAEADHVFGFQIKSVPDLLSANHAVDIDYDQKTRRLVIRNGGVESASIRLVLSDSSLECPAGETIEITLPEALPIPHAETLASRVAVIFETRGKETIGPAASGTALKEAWRIAGSDYIHAFEPITYEGKQYLAIADGKRVVIAAPDGSVLRTIERADIVGNLYWWPGPKLLMVGCKDDSLGAFDFEGREVWSHKAEMAPELEATQKGYWFKRAIPGVTALKSLTLANGREALFVGGTGTVEILDENGRLEKRFRQVFGAVDGFAVIPSMEGQPSKMLCKRSMGDWPRVYEVTPTADGWSQRDMGRGMLTDRAGTDMGSFGYSAVGRSIMIVTPLIADGPPRIVGDYNGVHNRLMLWDLSGKSLGDVNLGPGFMATGIDKSNYGRSIRRNLNVRGLAVADLDGDGRNEIIVALDRRYVLGFDEQLKQRFVVRLNASPVLMQAISRREKPPVIAVGDSSGQVTFFDSSGSSIATVALGGIPTAMAEADGRILVGNDKGEVIAYDLP